MEQSAPAFLLTAASKWSLGLRLLLSMMAGGLRCVAVVWRAAFPDEQYLADLVAGGAAALVAIHVLSVGWKQRAAPQSAWHGRPAGGRLH
jgi:Cd2+/Zn2+-exporting ATPase